MLFITSYSMTVYRYLLKQLIYSQKNSFYYPIMLIFSDFPVLLIKIPRYTETKVQKKLPMHRDVFLSGAFFLNSIAIVC